MLSREQRIRLFFAWNGSCGLKLPRGWFGRPYDNRLSLVCVCVDGDSMVIELDFPIRLLFKGIPTLESMKNKLCLTGFNSLKVEWKEAGNSQLIHRENYISGKVCFIAQ